MTDLFDQATFAEERDRELAIRAARNAPQRDIEAEVCNGCSYASKTAWGRSCDGWRECLEDQARRDRCRA